MSAALPCPCCGHQMHFREVAQVLIHGCGTCGGIWLDNQACQHLTSGGLPPEMLRLARAVHEFAWNMQQQGGPYRQAARPRVEGPRRCAVCREPLTVTRVHATEVDVDVCVHHGTWFDPTELGTLDTHFGQKRMSDAAAAARFGAQLEEAKWDRYAGYTVVEVMGVPFYVPT